MLCEQWSHHRDPAAIRGVVSWPPERAIRSRRASQYLGMLGIERCGGRRSIGGDTREPNVHLNERRIEQDVALGQHAAVVRETLFPIGAKRWRQCADADGVSQRIRDGRPASVHAATRTRRDVEEVVEVDPEVALEGEQLLLGGWSRRRLRRRRRGKRRDHSGDEEHTRRQHG